MEKRLYEAAVEGNVAPLLKLLGDDPLLLDRCVVGPLAESPLHVASLLGHVEFVNEILSRKPELTSEVDSQGSSPLHLAASKGYLTIVKNLLVANPEMCFSRDKFGRNPVHVSAMKGRVEVLKEMVRVSPGAALEMMSNGDTILHLCVKNNKLECLKVLVAARFSDEELLNSKNNDGDTILHLAAEDQQSETINFLTNNTKIDTSARNQNDLIALEILARANVEKVQAPTNYGSSRDEIEPTAEVASTVEHPLPAERGQREQPKEQEAWLEKMSSALMVVAILTATMAFQAGVNPPSGVWQDNDNGHAAGYSIMAYNYPSDYTLFLASNTVSFIASLSIILLLISGIPLKRRLVVWVLMVIMWAAITGNALTYLISISVFTPSHRTHGMSPIVAIVIFVWVGLMALLLVAHTARLLIRLVRIIFIRPNSSMASTIAGV